MEQLIALRLGAGPGQTAYQPHNERGERAEVKEREITDTEMDEPPSSALQPNVCHGDVVSGE
ncbi:hypothetical protein NQZ68_019158 [Dissostichus eleginoides]|nr:hypothetical protein NQZ68_019158 [Dissostichus eleginoides]